MAWVEPYHFVPSLCHGQEHLPPLTKRVSLTQEGFRALFLPRHLTLCVWQLLAPKATHLPGPLPCTQINCTHHFHTSTCREAPLLAVARGRNLCLSIAEWQGDRKKNTLQQHKQSSCKESLPDADLLFQSQEEGRCQTAQIYFWLMVSPFKTLILHAEGGDDP